MEMPAIVQAFLSFSADHPEKSLKNLHKRRNLIVAALPRAKKMPNCRFRESNWSKSQRK
ncbi:hypothetical protein HQN90_16875 [Paenibacillus alba]|nr:hypothetical protein [Paenibacillus alba]